MGNRIRHGLKKKWLLGFICILGVMLYGPKEIFAESNLDTKFLAGFDEVVLYVEGVDTSGDYQEAIRCHGIEEQCADVYIAKIPDYMKPTAESRDQYLNRLKETYRDCPPPLRTHELESALGGAILKKFKKDPIIVADRKLLEAYIDKKGTLIVIVKLSIQTDTVPHIAVLNSSLHRFGLKLKSTDLFEAVFYRKTAAIPLDLAEEEIAKRVLLSIRGGWHLNFPGAH